MGKNSADHKSGIQEVGSGRPVIAVDATELQGRPTGVGRYLHNLIVAWSQLPANVDFELYHSAPLTWQIPDDPRFSFVEVGKGLLKAGWYQQQRMLAKALNTNKPDLFFAPAYMMPLLWRGPAVLAVHDLSFERYPQWYPKLYGFRIRQVCRRSCKKAVQVITGSNFARDELVELYNISPQKISVITHSVQLNGDPVTASFKEEKPYVLVLGSIFERRFPEKILAAWQILKEKNISLKIVGDDRRTNGTNFQEDIAELGLSDWVTWHKYVDDHELPKMIDGAAAMLYLSKYEGFGLPPLEAMNRGIPAIVSARGALKEVYQDHAVLVEQETPEQIAQAVTSLLTDEENWKKYSQLGLELAKERNHMLMGKETLQELLRHV